MFNIQTMRIMEAGIAGSLVIGLLLRLFGLVDSILVTAGILFIPFLVFWMTQGGIVTNEKARQGLETFAVLWLVVFLFLPVTWKLIRSGLPRLTSATAPLAEQDTDLSLSQAIAPIILEARKNWATLTTEEARKRSQEVIDKLVTLENGRSTFTPEGFQTKKEDYRNELKAIYEENKRDKKLVSGWYYPPYWWDKIVELKGTISSLSTGEFAAWLIVLAGIYLVAGIYLPWMRPFDSGLVSIVIIFILAHWLVWGGGVDWVKGKIGGSIPSTVKVVEPVGDLYSIPVGVRALIGVVHRTDKYSVIVVSPKPPSSVFAVNSRWELAELGTCYTWENKEGEIQIVTTVPGTVVRKIKGGCV